MLLKITHRSQFPACLQPFKQVKGICVGGCLDYRKGDAKLARHILVQDQQIAHVHQGTDTFRGWICLAWKFLLKEKYLLLHEAAHLMTDADIHGKEFRRILTSLGGTYKPYQIHFRQYVIFINDYTYTRL